MALGDEVVASVGGLLPLLPGASGCATLITGRPRLTTLVTEHAIDLPMMPHEQALDLVHNLIGADRTAQAHTLTNDLIRLCGALPLALHIAGANWRTGHTGASTSSSPG
ncbi:hypothetical protein [Nonomuraea jabiensis]|uniref:hypothetical protein n=1 Tax=Nonomuraea jabiensis TaxID=882448 RepID=UPI003D719FB3